MRPSRATANRLRLVLSAAAVCAMTLGAAQAAGYSENFGGGYYANGVKAYATGTHTWNYAQDHSFEPLNDICAYISSGSDGSGAIAGSGCAPGINYSFCHTPVVHLYYAFIEHFNDSGTKNLFGYAETGRSCGAAAPAVSAVTFAAPPPDFAAFSRSQQPQDVLPASAAGLAAADNSSGASPGIDASGARLVGGNVGVYALPSARGLCAALTLPTATALACNGLATASAVTAFTISDDGGFIVWGAANDTVHAVRVTLNNGVVESVPVNGNGFAVSVASPPTQVETV